MDSVRIVRCAQPACAQVVFLCRRCDRGQVYCGRACAGVQRRATLRAAGARYQATRGGRRRHAARQQRYRLRRGAAEKVTHHASAAVAAPGTTPLARDWVAGRAAEVADAACSPFVLIGSVVRCHRCGHASAFVRDGTLARSAPRPWAAAGRRG